VDKLDMLDMLDIKGTKSGQEKCRKGEKWRGDGELGGSYRVILE